MVTTVTEEVKQRQRTGFNYMTIPGCEDTRSYHSESLDRCIRRVFKVFNIDVPTRETKVVYARHFKRHILERLTPDNKLTTASRLSNPEAFKFTLHEIASMLNCTHRMIIYSSREAQKLIDTDKKYRSMATQVFKKIELNLIIFP